MRKKFSELSKQELANNPNSYVLLGDISVGMFMDKDDNLRSEEHTSELQSH